MLAEGKAGELMPGTCQADLDRATLSDLCHCIEIAVALAIIAHCDHTSGEIAMRALILIFFITLSGTCYAQSGSRDIELYKQREVLDYYKGQIKLTFDPHTHSKLGTIYSQLEGMSGMRFRVIPHQTFRWGIANAGGLILIDISFLAKPTEVLAFLMGHEWGHLALGHQPSIYMPRGRPQFRTSATATEDEADAYAGEFLARFGYDVAPVIRFLRSVPKNPHDKAHSSGVVRAKTVLAAYKKAGGGSNGKLYRAQTQTACPHTAHPYDLAPCSHRAHPQGDLGPCQHLAHSQGDLSPCRHPAHPRGDLSRCQHAAHPRGDLSRCVHPAHPRGDLMNGRIFPCRHPAHPGGDLSPCRHPAHPRGDLSPCRHRAHPRGDLSPCQHKAHPRGDLSQCQHPTHRRDLVRCQHKLHPRGCQIFKRIR